MQFICEMKYEKAEDIEQEARKIIEKLNLNHIKVDDVAFVRSIGSKSRRTIARCHALGKIMQNALGRKAFYVLEFLHERFDKLNEEEKIKVIIHELMHIPKCFGGGFKYHDYVCEKNIRNLYEIYKNNI